MYVCNYCKYRYALSEQDLHQYVLDTSTLIGRTAEIHV